MNENRYDILSYRGKLYYRESLFNGLNTINTNYKIKIIRKGE